MHAVLGKGRLISIAALAILASGCASMDDVKHAQASWSRIGPVPDEAKRALSERFQRAVRQIAGETGRMG